MQIYAVLDHKRQQLDPTPPLPHHAELNRPIRLADGVVIPSVDESLEPDGEDAVSCHLALSPRYLKSLGESIQIEENGEPILMETAKPSQPAKDAIKDARIIAAESWVLGYRVHSKSIAVRKTVKATAASLRAYHIWHYNRDLNPEAIARLLRNPPLQTLTVVNYILEAIRLEKLPYDAPRLQAEVLSLLPKEILGTSRYKSLTNACRHAIGAELPTKA